MKPELDVLPLISSEQNSVGSGQRNLLCPICGCINTHIEAPYLKVGESWHGNDDLAITPLWSECGSKWEVCIGFHKGEAPIFVRINKPCKDT